MKITYVTGDPASGKSFAGHALAVYSQQGGAHVIIVDDGKVIDRIPRRETPSALVAEVGRFVRHGERIHVVLIGDSSKPHLDALLAAFTNREYYIHVTARG